MPTWWLLSAVVAALVVVATVAVVRAARQARDGLETGVDEHGADDLVTVTGFLPAPEGAPASVALCTRVFCTPAETDEGEAGAFRLQVPPGRYRVWVSSPDASVPSGFLRRVGRQRWLLVVDEAAASVVAVGPEPTHLGVLDVWLRIGSAGRPRSLRR